MKGDFSRLTFDPKKHFTRVLMQQGRVQLDADWNEQAAILLHYLERLAADLIGPYGGPADLPGFPPTLGFAIDFVKNPNGQPADDFTIGPGRYYVDGLLCENPAGVTYFKQPFLPLEPGKLPAAGLVYLDVWERHVNSLEDEDIREVALEGPDTATRAQVIWQVRASETMPDGKTTVPRVQADFEKAWDQWVQAGQPPRHGSLKARAKPSGDPTDPCVASPDAHYRGLANQLYRVEVHTGGVAGQGATFVWSRDNGSVVFPVVDIQTDSKSGTTTVSLEHLGYEGRSALVADDWVEVSDDTVLLKKGTGALLQVAAVDADRAEVTLRGTPDPKIGQGPHPLLRRWDYRRPQDAQPADGAILIQEGMQEGADLWLDLEDGVQVAFQPAPAPRAAYAYRPGDYWLIPARTVTGDVLWPGPQDAPESRPPHGIHHRYAPLALFSDGKVTGLRKKFFPLSVGENVAKK